MLLQDRNGFAPTRGERSLVVAYAGIAFFGAIVAFSVVNQLENRGSFIRALSPYDWWIIFAGASGAYGGLYLGRVWLGHPGLHGWWRAIVAIPVISFMASLIGGTLALPGHGTMFGPLAMLTTLIANPLLACFWTSMIFAAHYGFVIWRAERETIFQGDDSDDF